MSAFFVALVIGTVSPETGVAWEVTPQAELNEVVRAESNRPRRRQILRSIRANLNSPPPSRSRVLENIATLNAAVGNPACCSIEANGAKNTTRNFDTCSISLRI